MRILLYATLFLLMIPAAGRTEEQPQLKVGAILSLSGGLEQWCIPVRKGVELAAAEPAPVKLEVIFEDDRSLDRRSVISAARKLIHVDQVGLISLWTMSLLPLLSNIAVESKIPLLLGGYDARVERGRGYVFGAFVNSDLMSREIAQFLVRHQGAKRLGIVMAEDDWSQYYEQPFRAEAQRLGAEVVLTETISAAETNTQPILLRLREARVQAVLAPLFSSSLYAFLRQAKEMRYEGAIHVTDGMFEEDLKLAGASAEGVFASQLWLESKELAAAVKARFGETAEPLRLGMIATGYDWVKHLQALSAKLIKDGKPLSRAALQEELKTFRSRGYLGELMFGQPPQKGGEVMVRVEQGRYVPVQWKNGN